MGFSRHGTCRGLLLAGLLTAAGSVAAIGLQVAPISLDLAARSAAEGLWLSNTGDAPLTAQVRVFHWTQVDGEERLEPSRGLVISPPMLKLDAGARQLVRVIRTGAPPAAGLAEDAYRVVVNEVPGDASKEGGLRFVLRYSIPVFIAPAGDAEPAPEVAWSLRAEGDHTLLEVRNTGRAHAQLSAIDFVAADGTRTPINPGLLGYVLAGAQMRWPLDPAPATFATGGTLSLRINGEPAEQPISLADPAR